MSDLLEVAVAAHGGLDRWNGITSIEVAASITGATWFVKGKGDALKSIRFEVDTTRERLTMDFVGQDKRSIFEPSRVVMQRGDGALIDSRDDPERSFDGHVFATPWDDIHVAYFSGEALWAYLTTPFLYTWPGFVTDEITPFRVGGETWQRLKVMFPDHIKTHTREQISCFGPDGLLRRQDYTVDILGGASLYRFPLARPACGYSTAWTHPAAAHCGSSAAPLPLCPPAGSACVRGPSRSGPLP